MTDHFAEAESYLQKIDTLEPADAYVAVVAAQAHAQLAQIGPARDMVGLQRQLLESMLPTPPSKAEQVKAAMEEAQALARAMPGPEEQVKPAVEEPTELYSVIFANVPGSRMLEPKRLVRMDGWWSDEDGNGWGEFSTFSNVEVLRVGIGEPEARFCTRSQNCRMAEGHEGGCER
jgi:hypothetical protein